MIGLTYIFYFYAWFFLRSLQEKRVVRIGIDIVCLIGLFLIADFFIENTL